MQRISSRGLTSPLLRSVCLFNCLPVSTESHTDQHRRHAEDSYSNPTHSDGSRASMPRCDVFGGSDRCTDRSGASGRSERSESILGGRKSPSSAQRSFSSSPHRQARQVPLQRTHLQSCSFLRIGDHCCFQASRGKRVGRQACLLFRLNINENIAERCRWASG